MSRVLKAGPILGLVYGLLLCAFAKPGERLVVIAFGACLGLFAELLVLLQSALSTRPLSAQRHIVEKVILLLAAHASLVGWAMADSPSAHAANWYARGGLARSVQVLATDVLGPVLSRTTAAPALLRDGTSPSTATKMNVLLIVLDSLRADRIEPRIAPNLTALAARGVSFDRAYVSTPQTLPSVATLLTGQEPHRHGVRTSAPDGPPTTLANAFAGAGYATVAIGDFSRSPFERIDLGFDETKRVHGSDWPAVLGIAREAGPRFVAEEVERTLHARKNAPFFATAYLPTAARPYAVPAPYYARYTDARYRGRYKYDARSSQSGDLDAADVRQLTSLCDGAVAAVDDAVGRMLRSLETAGLADRTVVAVIGSRGEELPRVGPLEQLSRRAGDLIGDSATHVPLIVFDPRLAPPLRGMRRAEIARDVDLLPTLRELIGLPAMPDLAGRSLAPAMHGRAALRRVAFAEGNPPTAALPASLVFRPRMVRDERYKLVYVPERSGARYILFDTAADPDEEHDVAASHPVDLSRLRTDLWSWMLEDVTMEERGGFLVPKRSQQDHDNVLFVALDGVRADAMPAPLRALTERGATFPRAFASAVGPRASMLSVLAGARPTELRDDALELLPRALRPLRARTGAFVETARRVDVAASGFETVASERDADAITRAAGRWINEHASERFFAFVHYGVSRDPSGSALRDIADATSELVHTVEALGLRDRTLVVIAGMSGLPASGQHPANVAEAARVPLVVIAPKRIRPGTTVDVPVRTVDIAPTILELAGIEPPAPMSGRSLVPLSTGATEAERRVVVTEGADSRAIEHESWRFVVTRESERLFDLTNDPTERHDLHSSKPDVVAEMRARLEAALANVPVASASAEETSPATIRLRFAGGGAARRIAGVLTIGDGRTKAASYEVRTVELGPEAVQGKEGKLDIAFRTHPASAVGVDIVVDPPTTPVTWQLWLDDEPWPDGASFAGPFGLASLQTLHGVATAEARAAADATAAPAIDPRRDMGLFVVREKPPSHIVAR